MADEPEIHDDDEDTLELTEEVQDGPEDDVDPNTNDADDDEEVGITFGDDPTEAKPDDTGLVKHLRQIAKDKDRELAELRKQVRAPEPVEVGKEPTMEDFDWDEDKFKEEWRAWNDRKQKAEQRTTASNQANEQQRQQWETRLSQVNEAKSGLGVADADEAFDNVKAALGDERVMSILYLADTPESGAQLMVALGKHPDRLTALAAQEDPIRFVKEVTRLEGQLKVVKKRKAPEPDRAERGSGRTSTLSADKQLEKLEKEAERTGDRTAVVNYKKKLQAAGK